MLNSTRWLLFFVLLLGAALAGLIVSVTYHGRRGDAPAAYAVVVDAGSSHTDFSVYTWTPTSYNETAYIQLVPTFSQQKYKCIYDKGISSFAANPKEVGNALQPCFSQTASQIPDNVRGWSAISIRATAGMRVLEETDSAQATAIISSLQSSVSQLPFDSSQSSVAILTGQEEGVYGWVTANFITNTLLSATTQQYGALDMGGASTQITFSPSVESFVDQFQVYLFGRTIRLYTHSYLCFGLNAALQRYKAAVIVAAAGRAVAPSPCVALGVNLSLTAAELAAMRNDSCTSDMGIPAALTAVTLFGTSNSTECAAIVTSLFFNGTQPLVGKDQPPLEGRYLAFGNGFVYTIDYFCARRTNPFPWCRPGAVGGYSFKAPALTQGAVQVCAESFDVLLNNSIGNASVTGYCFNGMFISTLLAQYGFNESYDAIEAVRELSNTTVGWSLGFMLAQTNLLWCREGDWLLAGAGYAAAVAVCSLVMLACLAYLVVRMLRLKRRGYSVLAMDAHSHSLS